MSDIQEITGKYEAVLQGLQIQAARLLDISEKRGKLLRKEATQISNRDLPLAKMVIEYIDWVTNATMIEEHRINTHAEYRTELVQFMLDKRIADDKIKELEIELEMKDEDIEKLTNELEELKNKLEETEEHVTMPIKKIKKLEKMNGKRRCIKCGGSMVGRHHQAKYCEDCSKVVKRGRIRKARMKRYRELKEKTGKNEKNDVNNVNRFVSTTSDEETDEDEEIPSENNKKNDEQK